MKTKMMVAAVAALMASTAPASAAVFNWTYSGAITTGGTVTASGTITTTNTTTTVNSRQAYTVTGITGTRNGITITGLATAFPTTFGGADNYLYVSGQAFTDFGVSYSLANGTYANLFADGTDIGEYFATNLAGTTGRSNALGTFTFSAANVVPEPSTWALMLLGFGMTGYAMRRRSAKVVFA